MRDLRAELPTIIGKNLVRFKKQTGAHARFDAIRLLFEVFIKYQVIVLLPIAKVCDEKNGQEAELQITKADGIGQWVGSLARLYGILKKAQPDNDWISEVLNWWRSPCDEPTTSACHDLATIFDINLDHGKFKPKNTLDFLVQIRNRISHGATTAGAYAKGNRHLDVLCSWIQNAPPCYGARVLFKTTASFSQTFRIYEGLSPTACTDISELDRIEFPIQAQRPTYVRYASEANEVLSAPPFIDFNDDTDETFLLNSAVRKGKAEFLDYYTNKRFDLNILGYDYTGTSLSSRKSVSGVGPIEPAVATNASVFARISLRPELIFSDKVPQDIEWASLRLSEDERVSLPLTKTAVVYALVSEAHTGGLKAHEIVGYVGQTEDLVARFDGYLREREKGREKVVDFLSQFQRIRFYYAKVPAKEDRNALEDWLIKAIDPPANTALKISTQKTTPAW